MVPLGLLRYVLVNQKETHFGIYLLPNLFTTASLFSAFYAIIAAFKGQYETAIIAIFIGMLADMLDGRIARLTNTQSDFGAQYDSMSDMVTFGVAPAILLYSWNLHHLGKFGWLVAFIFTAAVAIRLARFNTQLAVADKRYFQGLPCPSGAAVVCSFIWYCHKQHFNHWMIVWFTALIAVLVAMLMVSSIRYYSFKEIDFKGKVPFLYLLLMVTAFVAIASNPSLVLLLVFGTYALSGSLSHFWLMRQRSREKKN